MQVPSYGNPKVAPAPLPNEKVRFDPDTFGGGTRTMIFQSTRGLADDAAKIAEEEQNNADAVLFTAAYNRAHMMFNRIESDAYKVKGQEAIRAHPAFMQSFANGLSDIEKGIANGRVRDRFRMMGAEMTGRLDRTLLHHGNNEMDKFDEAQTETAVENKYNDALKAVSAGDFRGADMNVAEAQASLEARVNRKFSGKPPEGVAESQKAKFASKVYLNALDQMLRGDRVEEAQQFHEERKGKLVGEDIATADAMMVRGVTLNKARAAANDIVATSTSYDEMRTKARNYGDANLAKHIESYVDDMIRQDKEKVHAEQVADEAEAVGWLEAKEGQTVEERIGYTRYKMLPQEAKDRLFERLERIKRHEKLAQSDAPLLAELIGNPEKLAGMSDQELANLRGVKLTNADYKSILLTREQAKNHMNAWNSEISKKQMFFSKIAQGELFGFDPKDTIQALSAQSYKGKSAAKEKLEKFFRLYADLDARITTRKDQTRPIGRAEFEEMMNDVVMDELRPAFSEQSGPSWWNLLLAPFGAVGAAWGLYNINSAQEGVPLGEMNAKERETARVALDTVPVPVREALYEIASKEGKAEGLERDKWEEKNSKKVGQAFIVLRMWPKGPARDKKISQILSGN